MKDSEVVAKARELISDRETWTKEVWCIGTPGHVKMCAEGAVRRALGLYDYVGGGHWEVVDTDADDFIRAKRIERELSDVAGKILPAVVRDLHENEIEMPDLQNFNDSPVTRHEDVLTVFDRTHENMIQEGR
ncbi:hypothetical protein [Mycobacterium phage WXIN]|nr:hypothetical protein [Mycobacterium phage WXIN]